MYEQPNANTRQVGGDHYKKHGDTGEQHWDRVARLGLDYFQAQVTKYVERCWDKNGVQDLEKARHFIDKYIEVSKAAGRLSLLEQQRAAVNQDVFTAKDALHMLLLTEILSEDGKWIGASGRVFDCLRGSMNDFTHEGTFGNGIKLWTCRACRTKVQTTGRALPHAGHSCDTQAVAAPA